MPGNKIRCSDNDGSKIAIIGAVGSGAATVVAEVGCQSNKISRTRLGGRESCSGSNGSKGGDDGDDGW